MICPFPREIRPIPSHRHSIDGDRHESLIREIIHRDKSSDFIVKLVDIEESGLRDLDSSPVVVINGFRTRQWHEPPDKAESCPRIRREKKCELEHGWEICKVSIRRVTERNGS
jgi:hypothetical protein